MFTKKKVLVNFILDKSGSMEVVRDTTISGVNEYIQTLKKDENIDYTFSLTMFDTEVVRPVVDKPLAGLEPLTKSEYVPNGGTALYDAVCRTIKQAQDSVADKVITVIMTDGEENSSREYDQNDMRDLIKRLEGKGNWTFVYLGANQDSYAVAMKHGFSYGNITNFNLTTAGTGIAMRTMAMNTSMTANSSNASTMDFFSKTDQETVEKTK